jgi:two-component system phosphate regulon sensor histidine kinase PhoR
VGAKSDQILIRVTDNGPGIPAKYIDKVFDKFFRVPAGAIHNTKGYGLGLSYARQVVEQHGGTIAVSNNATEGCTFTITLPRTLS